MKAKMETGKDPQPVVRETNEAANQIYHDEGRSKLRGGWLKLPRLYCRVFGNLEGLLLADLLNHASKVDMVFDSDSYFRCTASYLKKFMRWEPKTQQRIIDWFEHLGILATKLRGSPPHRWIKFDFEKLNQLLTAYETDGAVWERGDFEKVKRKQKPKPIQYQTEHELDESVVTQDYADDGDDADDVIDAKESAVTQDWQGFDDEDWEAIQGFLGEG